MKKLFFVLFISLITLIGCKKDPEPELPPQPLKSANCFIISEAGRYSFETVKGESNEEVGEVAGAEVLWESFGTEKHPSAGSLIKSVSYRDGEIVFKATDKKGNAVIAAKDASGETLWSWHIWLTDQPKEQKYHNNAGTVMDRNLGATSATPGEATSLGLLYQWGRKDPFLGSSSIDRSIEARSSLPSGHPAVQSDKKTGKVEYAIANPTTFISYNYSNYDWYYTGSKSTDNTRWSTSEKTIHDPCPRGWRVPASNNIWTDALGSAEEFTMTYDTDLEGMDFSGKFGSDESIWYPATGCRYAFDGSLGEIPWNGNYWTSSPEDNNACGLYLTSDEEVDPACGYQRAIALSVRCVKK